MRRAGRWTGSSGDSVQWVVEGGGAAWRRVSHLLTGWWGCLLFLKNTESQADAQWVVHSPSVQGPWVWTQEPYRPGAVVSTSWSSTQDQVFKITHVLSVSLWPAWLVRPGRGLAVLFGHLGPLVVSTPGLTPSTVFSNTRAQGAACFGISTLRPVLRLLPGQADREGTVA